MAATLPYLSSNKNVAKVFERILAAKQPDAFTHAFLAGTIGLKGSNDRQLIPLLRALGFLDPSGRPTANYALLKNSSTASRALAEAIRTAYKPVFDASQDAQSLSSADLKGLIGQVAGTDEDMTSRISGTLNALTKLADFSTNDQAASKEEPPASKEETPPDGTTAKLRPEFHYNIQVHLPANATEETYLQIFNSLRKAFQ